MCLKTPIPLFQWQHPCFIPLPAPSISTGTASHRPGTEIRPQGGGRKHLWLSPSASSAHLGSQAVGSVSWGHAVVPVGAGPRQRPAAGLWLNNCSSGTYCPDRGWGHSANTASCSSGSGLRARDGLQELGWSLATRSPSATLHHPPQLTSCFQVPWGWADTQKASEEGWCLFPSLNGTWTRGGGAPSPHWHGDSWDVACFPCLSPQRVSCCTKFQLWRFKSRLAATPHHAGFVALQCMFYL